MIELTENALVRGMGHANSGVNGHYIGLISRWLINTYGVEPQQQASIDAGANKVLRIAEDGTRANGEYERIKIHVKGLEATNWTLTEAAEHCGVARITLRRALKAGKFPNATQPDGRVWQVPVTDLIAAGFDPGRPSPAEPDPEKELALKFLANENGDLLDANAKLRAMNDRQANTIDELRKKVENNEPAPGELGGLRLRNAALYTTNKELSEAKGALQADNARLRAANTNLSSDNETLRADLHQARINRDFFFDRNKEKAKRINELTDKVNRLTSDMIEILRLADQHAADEVKDPIAGGAA